MVAKGSPEWFSAGWTVVYKVQKTGRKIRFYKHLETGKSFVSKDDVSQFIKSSLNQKPLQTAKNRKLSVCSMQPPVETNEYPSWLPDGWNVEMKTRMSGRTVGSLYKCYIDPVSGNKFYSKPEVLRYLRTLKPESRTFNQKEKNTTKTAVEQCKEADLPQGWIRETKITKNAQGTRRDSFYTDPVTGYTFRSRLEVFRYLKTGKISRYAIKSKKRNSTDQPLINNKSSCTTKRQKTEKTPARQPVATGKGRSKKSSEEILEDERKQTEDGLKTSPQKPDTSAATLESKHINSSPKTVMKQLSQKKGKKNRRSKIRSDPTKILLTENVLSPSTTVGFSQGTDLLEKETGGQKAQITQTKPRKSKDKKLKDHMPPHRSSKRLAGKEPEFMPISKSRLRRPQVSDGNGIKVVTLPDLNLNSDSYADKPNEELVVNPEAKGVDHAYDETNGVSNGNLNKSCDNEEQTTSPVVETEKVDKGESEEQFSVPIADFFSDPCLEFAIKTLTGALPVVDAANNGPDSILTANNSQGKILSERKTESRINKRSRGNPKTLKNKKELCFPSQSLKRSAELKLEPGANSMATEQGWQNSERVLCKNKAIVAEEVLAAIKPVKGPAYASSTIIGDTTIRGEPFKKSEKPNENGAILNENHHARTENKTAESNSSFPFGFSWSDPCLDFAFKTLTGSIPVDDSLGIHSFFQENLESAHSQRDSTITLPEFGSSSYFQSENISSQLDPVGISGTNSSFLPMGNVSLSGFGTMRQAHIKGDKVSKGK